MKPYRVISFHLVENIRKNYNLDVFSDENVMNRVNEVSKKATKQLKKGENVEIRLNKLFVLNQKQIDYNFKISKNEYLGLVNQQSHNNFVKDINPKQITWINIFAFVMSVILVILLTTFVFRKGIDKESAVTFGIIDLLLIMIAFYIFRSLIWLIFRPIIIAFRKSELFNYYQPVISEVSQQLSNMSATKDNLEYMKFQLEKDIEQKRQQLEIKIQTEKDAIQKICSEKSNGFPWLADAFADFFYLEDLKVAKKLQTKSRPALKASEEVREIAHKLRICEKEKRVVNYKLKYLENMFPWINDLFDESLDEILQDIKEEEKEGFNKEDDATKWLSELEYTNLSTAKKYQLALDRYIKSRKSKWQIGREFERYVGFLYEKDGFKVKYFGAIQGFDDLGRDIIAEKKDEVQIIQCKYWSTEKVIHEKHIFQLYGTVFAYSLENPHKKVIGSIITSTQLSDRAKQFSQQLNINYRENFKMLEYPRVKCNISKRDGTYIYHLPFDQQYDKINIEFDKSECYVNTVMEAEEKGFRRAFRWIPNS